MPQPGMQQMLKQVQKMQAEMARAQEELAAAEVQASAGGGMVSVRVTGGLVVKEIRIDPAAIDPEDPELLADMVLAAVNEALRSAQELAAGKPLSKANQTGYSKALMTIIDAHVVQLIICAIMIWLGTGPIRGFGVTLAIGVLSTMFSVLITVHLVLELLIDSGTLKKITMRRLIKPIHVDFIRYGLRSFVGSWMVVLLVADIRRVAERAKIDDINVTYESALGGGSEQLKIETPEGRSGVLLDALKAADPQSGLVEIGENHLGASIGREIMLNALKAIIVSMLVILLYIAFRFEFCIAGYSINETVVVFDRIREELKLNPTGSLREIINSAINKVFARTIMTSSTTFLAALSLYLFGSGVLRDISFTFLVGIVTSTFSAIFIAAQVFYWWHKGDRKHVEAHADDGLEQGVSVTVDPARCSGSTRQSRPARSRT